MPTESRRRPTSVFLFLAVIAAAHAVPLLAWELDMKWLWPCSDFLRRLPWVLDDILASWADVWTGVVVMMQMLVSELAAVHWPVALLILGELYLQGCLLLQAVIFSSSCVLWLSVLQHLEGVRCCLTQNVRTCSAGAATIFMSGRAKQFWKCTVVSILLLYFFRICFGHRGALSFSGDKAIDGIAVSAVVGLLCLATMPQGSMRHRLWSGVWSGLQYVFARIGYRRHFYNSTTAQLQPLRSRSLSSAASGEVFATDAETASTPGICITADGSTASHQAAHHAAGFSASSQMPKAPVSGSNEATDASRPDDGTSLCIRSSTTSTEADHPKFVCFWLGKPGKSTDCPRQASPCMLCLYWCVSLLSHCPRQHCSHSMCMSCPPFHFCILSLVFQTWYCSCHCCRCFLWERH